MNTITRDFIKVTTLILIAAILYSCARENNTHHRKALVDNWFFKSTDDTNWFVAEVPGTVHTDLISNGIIEDPFYRLNEHDVQWVDKKDWEYRTTFNVDKSFIKKDVIELVFNGLDTYSKIYLNDSLILSTNNMFISHSINCKSIIKEGENRLHIVFESPIKIGLEKREKLGYYLPGAENDQSNLGGLGDKKVAVFTRKAGYHFGWDWGPRLVSSGIWQNIELVAWDKAKIIEANIIQNEIGDKVADLTIELEIESTENLKASLVTQIDEKVAHTQEVKLSKGVNKISYPLEILYPKLWWPNGLGEQKLYDFNFGLVSSFEKHSSYSKSIGLRTIEIVQEPDSIGSSFFFKVNGYPVFMKGANYIPQDVFLTKPTADDYAFLIKSAVDANFNMLRVWGGGIYEQDIFYDLCDEAGILVWQDFMFACAMYPGNKDFLNNVEKEAIQNVVRLRNHPCIALWCGDNEILSAWNRWGWKENVMKNQGNNIADTIWNVYDTIFHAILPNVVAKYDPKKLYWSSSPSSGFGKLENGKSGDNHYWGVWWAKEPFSKYEEEIPRFMSEFGFQSFPQFSSVKKYTDSTDWDIYSDVMKSHQRSSIGNVTIDEYMKRDYKNPKNFEMFLYVGQLLQARGIEIGIRAHRRAMPYCMGSLYWQLNDCWPVASWSGIDYYGNWKALHYRVKKSFKETIISPVIKDNKVDAYIINDRLSDIKGNLNITVMDFSGRVLFNISDEITVKANTSKIYYKADYDEIITGDKGKLLIYSTLTSGNDSIIDQNISYFVSPKELQLIEPELDLKVEQISDGDFVLYIKTTNLAKNVFISSEIEGHFSDNYFDLIPGEQATIHFYPHETINIETLKSDISIITLLDTYKR